MDVQRGFALMAPAGLSTSPDAAAWTGSRPGVPPTTPPQSRHPCKSEIANVCAKPFRHRRRRHHPLEPMASPATQSLLLSPPPLMRYHGGSGPLASAARRSGSGTATRGTPGARASVGWAQRLAPAFTYDGHLSHRAGIHPWGQSTSSPTHPRSGSPRSGMPRLHTARLWQRPRVCTRWDGCMMLSSSFRPRRFHRSGCRRCCCCYRCCRCHCWAFSSAAVNLPHSAPWIAFGEQ